MWNQNGRICLWRYTENQRNYPGWHLSADADGCASLLSLLDQLPTATAAYRTLQITAPSAAQLRVPNNRAAGWLAPCRLRIEWAAHPATWLLPEVLDPAQLSLGADWLAPLRAGIADIAERRGDYAIGNRDARLWFWWWPRPLAD
ncbi:hypothetical protein [Aquimonas sp.]|jgi:hypothetical protein|uniref:hypothetical protein n=1 Tax=Aquimonas sp. TaxID=1872588 RepID=UPI0037BE27A5